MRVERRQPTPREWERITSHLPVVRWVLEQRPNTERSGVNPHVHPKHRIRLEAAGWRLVETRSGRSLWYQPSRQRRYTLGSALKQAMRQERAELEAAGWEAVEGERETFWRRPDTRHLYAQEAAIEVVRRLRGEEE